MMTFSDCHRAPPRHHLPTCSYQLGDSFLSWGREVVGINVSCCPGRLVELLGFLVRPVRGRADRGLPCGSIGVSPWRLSMGLRVSLSASRQRCFIQSHGVCAVLPDGHGEEVAISRLARTECDSSATCDRICRFCRFFQESSSQRASIRSTRTYLVVMGSEYRCLTVELSH